MEQFLHVESYTTFATVGTIFVLCIVIHSFIQLICNQPQVLLNKVLSF